MLMSDTSEEVLILRLDEGDLLITPDREPKPGSGPLVIRRTRRRPPPDLQPSPRDQVVLIVVLEILIALKIPSVWGLACLLAMDLPSP